MPLLLSWLLHSLRQLWLSQASHAGGGSQPPTCKADLHTMASAGAETEHLGSLLAVSSQDAANADMIVCSIKLTMNNVATDMRCEYP